MEFNYNESHSFSNKIISLSDNIIDIQVNRINENGKIPLITIPSYNGINLDKIIINLIKQGIVFTPYGNIDFSSGLVYGNFNIIFLPEMFNQNIIDSEDICNYLNAMETKPCRLDIFESPYFDGYKIPAIPGKPNLQPKVDINLNEIKLIGRSFENDALFFAYSVKDSKEEIVNGKFSINEIYLTYTQGYYFPIIDFDDNTNSSVIKQILSIIFSKGEIPLGSDYGSIKLNCGVKVKVDKTEVPMFPHIIDQYDKLVEITQYKKTNVSDLESHYPTLNTKGFIDDIHIYEEQRSVSRR